MPRIFFIMFIENFISAFDASSERTSPPAATKGPSGSPASRFIRMGRTSPTNQAHFPPGTSRAQVGDDEGAVLIHVDAESPAGKFSFGRLQYLPIHLEDGGRRFELLVLSQLGLRRPESVLHVGGDELDARRQDDARRVVPGEPLPPRGQIGRDFLGDFQVLLVEDFPISRVGDGGVIADMPDVRFRVETADLIHRLVRQLFRRVERF